MALRFLLDEHLSPELARALQRARPKVPAIALRDWKDGLYLGAPDHLVLSAAYQERVSLVTYDQRTIVPLLKSLAENGTPHGGVVLIDHRTIGPTEVGRLARVLTKLWDAEHSVDWVDRVLYLTR